MKDALRSRRLKLPARMRWLPITIVPLNTLWRSLTIQFLRMMGQTWTLRRLTSEGNHNKSILIEYTLHKFLDNLPTSYYLFTLTCWRFLKKSWIKINGNYTRFVRGTFLGDIFWSIFCYFHNSWKRTKILNEWGELKLYLYIYINRYY